MHPAGHEVVCCTICGVLGSRCLAVGVPGQCFGPGLSATGTLLTLSNPLGQLLQCLYHICDLPSTFPHPHTLGESCKAAAAMLHRLLQLVAATPARLARFSIDASLPRITSPTRVHLCLLRA